MLVEVNDKGLSHEQYSARFSPTACAAKDRSEKHGYCLNCGWVPMSVQETGAEIVIHLEWEGRNIEWYDKHLRLKTPQGRLISELSR